MYFNLNLNVDHFATLRNARGGNEPDPATAAVIAELAGATGIVTHLRKDRRHINDKDVLKIKDIISTKLNLEMSSDAEIVDFACNLKPAVSTIVPETDNEITTEGGLDVVHHIPHLKEVAKKLHDNGIQVSLFIEPDREQIDAALEVKADIVEFNTKYFAIAFNTHQRDKISAEISKLYDSCDYSEEQSLYVAAGHSLNYSNIVEFCNVTNIMEYNIGHSIVARSALVGINAAVKEMLDVMTRHKVFYCV
ncbi:MAG: pyridoxine 5'-phosphate synthase [Ignavibacteria bacterium]|jgi:pyridoxine 5-phosphate synthase|nr:pyridoxine 5'-phosphate synthase [Ignavibacteria bacterium]